MSTSQDQSWLQALGLHDHFARSHEPPDRSRSFQLSHPWLDPSWVFLFTALTSVTPSSLCFFCHLRLTTSHLQSMKPSGLSQCSSLAPWIPSLPRQLATKSLLLRRDCRFNLNLETFKP